jgi:hypothetical protein
MDETDRLAAATIVAAMITAGHPLVRSAGGMTTNWGSIAKGWFECAQALAEERQDRERKAGSR